MVQTKPGVEHVRSLMSAPVKKRGKEREIPKAKKPSALRKVRYLTLQWHVHCFLYTMGHKNVPLYLCPYLRQLSTDF